MMVPHWMTTRQEAMQRSRVLLAADTTEVNLSSHETAEGLGPIGRGNKAQGFFVHTVLAMDATTQQLLGCMYQEPFVRQPAPKGETKAQRKKRVRESQVWERSIQAIGPVPDKQQWIYVGDRGSDIYTFGKPASTWDTTLWCVSLRIAVCLSTKCLKPRTPKCSVSKPWHALCQHKMAEFCVSLLSVNALRVMPWCKSVGEKCVSNRL